MRSTLRRALSLPFALSLGLTLACGPSASPPVEASARPTPPPTEIAPAAAPAAANAPPAEGDAPASAEQDTYEVLAGVRYVELVTGDAAATDELPMVIAIHGLGDRPENFAGLLQGLTTPARVILPAGLKPSDDGFSWFDIRARSRDVEALAKGIGDASDTLATFIDTVSAERPTLGKPIVTGFSQGGMLSFAIAAGHPESVSAAFPVSGWLPPPLWPEAGPKGAPTPVVALHGDADNAVLIEPTRLAVDRLQELGYPVELREYPEVRHQITAEMRTVLWSLLRTATEELAAGKAVSTPAPAARTTTRPSSPTATLEQ